MKASLQSHHRRERGYFALGIALLISVVASALVVSLRAKLARVDAESVLADDREDYAVARQLENLVHDSIQYAAGQRARIHSDTDTIETEIANRLAAVSLPPDSSVALLSGASVPTPPSLAFFPQATSNFTRTPLTGKLTAGAVPYGAAGGLLRSGYYTPSTASQSYFFVRTRHQEPETELRVDATYYAVPLTSQRLILYNYPTGLGGTRPASLPDLNYLDLSNTIRGLVTTQFTQASGVIDGVNAPGAGESMAFYRHRSQVCEEIFYHLFKGDYFAALLSHGSTLAINVSDIALALETHSGLYTEEQEATPPGEPLPPPTDSRFKMDVAQFDANDVVYFQYPFDSPVEVTLLDTDNVDDQVLDPIVILFDGRADSGSFKIRFQEFIHRPILFVLASTTVEFTGSTTGDTGIPSGAISGAYLMDENSGFTTDNSDSQDSRIVYGAILAHHSLLTSGFAGAGGHPAPVLEFPTSAYYDALESFSPRALLVTTKSQLIPVAHPDALVLAP